jgi:GMP synthase (glutamine-hydrolysing)
MRAYLNVQAPDLEKEGFKPDTLIRQVEDSPHATSLLQRFSDLVIKRRQT